MGDRMAYIEHKICANFLPMKNNKLNKLQHWMKVGHRMWEYLRFTVFGGFATIVFFCFDSTEKGGTIRARQHWRYFDDETLTVVDILYVFNHQFIDKLVIFF